MTCKIYLFHGPITGKTPKSDDKVHLNFPVQLPSVRVVVSSQSLYLHHEADHDCPEVHGPQDSHVHRRHRALHANYLEVHCTLKMQASTNRSDGKQSSNSVKVVMADNLEGEAMNQDPRRSDGRHPEVAAMTDYPGRADGRPSREIRWQLHQGRRSRGASWANNGRLSRESRWQRIQRGQ